MYQNRNKLLNWGLIITSLIIVILILWNTYSFFQKYRREERVKMEILAAAYKRLNNPDLDADTSLELAILESNTSIPMIVTYEDGSISLDKNLNESKKKRSPEYLQKQLAIMKAQNKPILVENNNVKQYIYYKDSRVLTNLKYYPIALVFILLLFAFIIYLFSRSNKIASQNQLWTGMAKETAHQIGTPLTSLLGWIAILKEDKADTYIADEIENDVKRLEVIAQRFSKIGSKPALQKTDLVRLTRESFTYLQSRSSQKVDFNFHTAVDSLETDVNPELLGWVIENLVKNAIDAMQGKGTIDLSVDRNTHHAIISVTDTGKGISRKNFTKIFEPGFTTKQRGWGIGLSLSKRIIEDFHKGKIFVKTSEMGQGTTFCVKIPLK